MTQPEKNRHWKSLAALLGAATPNEAVPATSDPQTGTTDATNAETGSGGETAGDAENVSSSRPAHEGDVHGSPGTLEVSLAATAEGMTPASTASPSPGPAAVAPSPERPAPKPVKPLPPRPKADWRSLAGMLGLPIPPEPEPAPAEPAVSQLEPPLPAADVVAEPPAEATPSPRVLPERETWPPAAERAEIDPRRADDEPRTSSLDDLFRSTSPRRGESVSPGWGFSDADEPIDPLEMPPSAFVDEVVDAEELEIVDVSEPEIAGEEGDVIRGAASDEALEERRRRRRRRRRRGGRRGEGEGTAESTDRDDTERRREGTDRPSAPGERAAGPTRPPRRRDERADDEPELTPEREDDEVSLDDQTDRRAGEDDTGEEGPSEERDEGRRRRRRRRRGRRGDRPAEAESRREAEPAADDHSADAGDDEDALAAVLADGDDELDGEGKDDELHLSHKKIPSWQEAIDVVIANNLAERAKHPSGGSRGRGRRDR